MRRACQAKKRQERGREAYCVRSRENDIRRETDILRGRVVGRQLKACKEDWQEEKQTKRTKSAGREERERDR
jgi:hypothetical protein